MGKTVPENQNIRLEIIRKAVNADIKNGVIPTTVKSFSELHDYVDANEYVILAYDGKISFSQKWFKEANKLMDEVDLWLKNNRP